MAPRYRWVLQPRLSKDLKIQLLYNRGLISSLNPSSYNISIFKPGSPQTAYRRNSYPPPFNPSTFLFFEEKRN